MYDIASSILQQKLAQVEGVGQVNIGGGSNPAVRVDVNPTILNALGLNLEDVRAVLAWAKRQGYTPDRIGWIGYSMGASILVMEGASNPSIHAAVLDSPYGNLPLLLNEQLSAHSGLPSVTRRPT